MQDGIQSWTGGTFLGACRQATVVWCKGSANVTRSRVLSDRLTCSIQCLPFEVTQSFHFDRDIRRWRIIRRGNMWQMSCPAGHQQKELGERVQGAVGLCSRKESMDVGWYGNLAWGTQSWTRWKHLSYSCRRKNEALGNQGRWSEPLSRHPGLLRASRLEADNPWPWSC